MKNQIKKRVLGFILMSFGGFLDNSTGSSGGARIVADIPYTNSNSNMPSSAIAQPYFVTQSLTKSMFNSPGLSLALVKISFFFLFSDRFFFVSGLKSDLGFCYFFGSDLCFVFIFYIIYYQQTNVDGQGDVTRVAESYEANNGGRRSREEEHESRSGSDNMDGASGDDQDAADNNPRKKKRYHRHTPQQIQELEAYFNKKNPIFLFIHLYCCCIK